jgi:type I restriction enzyme, S subunit
MTIGVLADLTPPSGWDWKKLWTIAPRVVEKGRGDLQPLSVFLDQGVVPRAERADNHNTLGADLDGYLHVLPGDVVFNKLRTWQGGLGVSRDEGIVSPAYFVCRPGADAVPRFLHYLLRSSPYLAELKRLSKWMPPSQFDIPWESLRALPLLLPPFDEQRRIADFLDDQIGRFDRMVNLRRRLVELLTEKAERAIRQHIAESLEVVGSDAAAHRIPLKRILTKVKRPPMPEGEAITAFRDGQVTARSRRRTEGFTEAWTESATFQGINVGDVVIHGLDGFAGAIGTSESEGVCSPVYHVCVPTDGDDPYFIGRMLRILALSDYLSLFGGSARQRAVDFRNWSSFARTQVPVVERSEQKKIGALLKQIQVVEDAVTRYTSLIGERKQALITAAVTGQFDVTAVSSVS